MEITVFDATHKIPETELEIVANFLFHELGEYGDTLSAIKKAIRFTRAENGKLGGYVLLAKMDLHLIGAAIINKTGMEEYIPENILVYLALHANYRGKGSGEKLLQKAIDTCQGDIALHVEKNNPARFLYEKLGFTNPYLEMRLKR